jgi:hypothetical protein
MFAVTGLQTRLQTFRGSKPTALKAVVVVCLIVLLMLALVHVADAHSSFRAADRCPICVVMHSVVPFLILAVAMLLVRVEKCAPELLEIHAIVRYWHPNLFTRPPPACC